MRTADDHRSSVIDRWYRAGQPVDSRLPHCYTSGGEDTACCTIPATTSHRRSPTRSRSPTTTRRSCESWPRELAEYAALPVHKEKAELWRRLNDLESVRPMVWINEIPWHEMDVDGELTLRTRDAWAQDQERDLRRTLYQWRHLPGDMILDDFLTCPLAIHSTDFGIVEDVELARTDEANDIVSREFHIQIRDFDDLEKIKMPVVTHNEAATEFRYQAMCEVYEGIMPVRKMGQTHIWFTPWDYLDPLVGRAGGDDGPGRAPRPGARRRGAHGGRLDGRAGPVRRA